MVVLYSTTLLFVSFFGRTTYIQLLHFCGQLNLSFCHKRLTWMINVCWLMQGNIEGWQPYFQNVAYLQPDLNTNKGSRWATSSTKWSEYIVNVTSEEEAARYIIWLVKCFQKFDSAITMNSNTFIRRYIKALLCCLVHDPLLCLLRDLVQV